MKTLRHVVIGLIVGMGAGLWFGVNIGKDKGLLTNPFAEPNVQQRVKRTGETLLEKSGQALEKSGKALQEKMRE
jgi:hypothetical protein